MAIVRILRKNESFSNFDNADLFLLTPQNEKNYKVNVKVDFRKVISKDRHGS
jgi:hypothetical protein